MEKTIMDSIDINVKLRMSVVIVLALMTSHAKCHLCISDPPQRLETGDLLYVDCYQFGQPPCGRDFPKDMTRDPTKVSAGKMLPVLLSMPVIHYSEELPGSIKINLIKDGSEDSTNLANERDGTEKEMRLNVPIPDREGLHILQAIYTAPGYEFYSCSDVYLTKESVPSMAPKTAITNSNATDSKNVETTDERGITKLSTSRSTYSMTKPKPTQVPSSFHRTTYESSTGNGGSKLQNMCGFCCCLFYFFMLVVFHLIV